jgi:hypothetical protein
VPTTPHPVRIMTPERVAESLLEEEAETHSCPSDSNVWLAAFKNDSKVWTLN